MEATALLQADGVYKVEMAPAEGQAAAFLVDTSIGKIVLPPPAPSRPPPTRLVRVLDSLFYIHTGAWGGLGSRIALAVAALGIATTSLIGGWAFLRRPGGRKPRA